MPKQFICERIESSPPASPTLWRRIGKVWQGASQTARLMIGIPDYQTYVEHCRQNHPETLPMSYEAFFRSRMDARYAGRAGRGCC